MIHFNNLQEGILIKRYKRFLADVLLKENNEVVTCHCPNSGSMLGVNQEGLTVYVAKKTNTKLQYSLELVKVENTLVAINTYNPNKLVKSALENNKISDFQNYNIQPEKTFLDSRIDFYLTNADKNIFIEVKSIHLLRNKNGLAEFPDTKTIRGQKHIKTLTEATNQGYTSYLFFLAQRQDAKSITIAKDLDPEYFKLLQYAYNNNLLKVICYNCKITFEGISINEQIPFIISKE